MAVNFAETSRAIEQDAPVKALGLLVFALVLALVWLAWTALYTEPVFEISNQVSLTARPAGGNRVELVDGAYRNHPTRVWTVAAAFSPAQRRLIAKGQPAMVVLKDSREQLPAVVLDLPSWRSDRVTLEITTEADRMLSPPDLAEVRVETARRSLLDRLGIAAPP